MTKIATGLFQNFPRISGLFSFSQLNFPTCLSKAHDKGYRRHIGIS